MDRFGEFKDARERYCEFRLKDVINICDGNRLGYVTDLEIDVCTGCICRIIVTERPKVWDIFCCPKEIIIDWEGIVQVGHDTILVDPRRAKLPHPPHPHL